MNIILRTYLPDVTDLNEIHIPSGQQEAPLLDVYNDTNNITFIRSKNHNDDYNIYKYNDFT